MSAEDIARADKLVRKHPHDAKALNDAGVLHAASGDREGGEKLLHKARQEAQDDPIIVYNDARTKLENGKIEEARHILEETLSTHPNFAEARIALAAIDVQQGDYVSAEQEISKLPQDKAQTVHALLVIGAIQFATGHTNEALKSFEEAIKADSDNVMAQFALACAYLVQNQLNSAERPLRIALHKNPSMPEARNNLGILLMRRGQQQEAFEEFYAAARNSENPMFTNNLARVSNAGRGNSQGSPDHIVGQWSQSGGTGRVWGTIYGHSASQTFSVPATRIRITKEQASRYRVEETQPGGTAATVLQRVANGSYQGPTADLSSLAAQLPGATNIQSTISLLRER